MRKHISILERELARRQYLYQKLLRGFADHKLSVFKDIKSIDIQASQIVNELLGFKNVVDKYVPRSEQGQYLFCYHELTTKFLDDLFYLTEKYKLSLPSLRGRP
jgi:hypothetical protein